MVKPQFTSEWCYNYRLFPVNTNTASCAPALASNTNIYICVCIYTIAFPETFLSLLYPNEAVLRRSVYTHTDKGKSGFDWLLNNANRHDKIGALKSVFDKHQAGSHQKIAFETKGFFPPLVLFFLCLFCRWPNTGPSLDKNLGFNCHFVQTNKSLVIKVTVWSESKDCSVFSTWNLSCIVRAV